MAKYYSLVSKQNGKWDVEFSDYDKNIVLEERECFNFHAAPAGTKLKIICTSDTQTEINNAIDVLNSKVK